LRHSIKVKNAKPEVTDRFQDGRRRHVGNSSECYKMDNYHPKLMQIGTQIKKNTLSAKIIKVEVYGHFQEDRRHHFGNSNTCCKMDNYHPSFDEI
jgi:hypothetical protein